MVTPRPQGLVQLLLYSLHLAGAAIDAEVVIHQLNGPPIPLAAGPIQWMNSQLDALGTRAAATQGSPRLGWGSVPGPRHHDEYTTTYSIATHARCRLEIP